MVQPLALTKPAVAQPAARPGVVGRRGAARLRLAIPVRLLTTRATQSCILLDLSCTGARIGLAQPLANGAFLYLKIAGLEVFAQVVRCSQGEGGGVNGLVFDEPLSDADVLAVRRYAESFEQRERDALREQVRRWVSGDRLG